MKTYNIELGRVYGLKIDAENSESALKQACDGLGLRPLLPIYVHSDSASCKVTGEVFVRVKECV